MRDKSHQEKQSTGQSSPSLLDVRTHPYWLSNVWLAGRRDLGEAFLVDAGFDAAGILATAEQLGVRIRAILLTHHHGDHADAAFELARRTGAPIRAHGAEISRLGAAARGCVAVEDGEEIPVAGVRIRVLHIPGHTAGQVAWLVPGLGVFTGDTLFRGSVGSTVAPGHTSFVDLRRSLVDRLLTLPDDTAVLPGHAAASDIGTERRTNPFLRVMTGQMSEGDDRCRVFGREARLVVWARDYDDGFKAWIRYADGSDAVVPGSRVERL